MGKQWIGIALWLQQNAFNELASQCQGASLNVPATNRTKGHESRTGYLEFLAETQGRGELRIDTRMVGSAATDHTAGITTRGESRRRSVVPRWGKQPPA